MSYDAKKSQRVRKATQSSSSMESPIYDCDNLARHYFAKESTSAWDSSSSSSVATYASTIASTSSVDDGSTSGQLPPMTQPWLPTPPGSQAQQQQQQQEQKASTISEVLADPLPSTSQDFAALFPSNRKLIIHHDHSYSDSSMNLRADMLVRTPGGETCAMTLYHLRMNDLRTRDCSLRRYQRDSGREVCSATAAVKQRPGAVREARKMVKEEGWRSSLGSVIAGLGHSKREKAATKANARGSFENSHGDSGYESFDDGEHVDEEDSKQSSGNRTTTSSVATMKNQINLEFSNYAHVDIKRRGVGKRSKHKHYDFEYWGVNYSWHRANTADDNNTDDMNYQLISHETNEAVAQIATIPLTQADAYAEIQRGSWVPPCSLWIGDGAIAKGKGDVADVVVATGMMCLVDGWVRKRFEV